MTMREWIALQAQKFYAADTAAGDLLGDVLRDLLDEIRACGAVTPEQFRERRCVLEASSSRPIEEFWRVLN